MTSLNSNAYRLSVSWPRVLPEGRGSSNSAGLGFYDKLIDELLENGIEPWVSDDGATVHVLVNVAPDGPPSNESRFRGIARKPDLGCSQG